MIKTPKYWEKDRYQPLVETETAYGNKVKIPKCFMNGWKTAKLTFEHCTSRGVNPLDGLEILEETQPMSYDLERVFYEIYQDED